MPSLSLRLLRKMSGLFDTGFAGSACDTASLGVNAPVSDASATDQLLSELGLAGSGEVSGVIDLPQQFPYVGVDGPSSAVKAVHESQQQPVLAETANIEDFGVAHDWDMLGESLADLETDQLADNSLDAFINLDQLLMGDSFLDQVSETQNVDNVKPQAPEHVTDVSTLDSEHLQHFDFFDLLKSPEAQINPITFNATSLPSTKAQETQSTLPPVVNKSSNNKESTSRKRKSTTKAEARPCKTSMFEIPVSENVVTTTYIDPSSPGLDHDYTSKQGHTVAKIEFDSYGTLKLTETVALAPEPSTSTDPTLLVQDKVALRRQKNNLASKRSREQRKQKFSELDLEAEELIVKNEALRQKIVELEKIAKEMKAALVAKMAGK